MMKPTLSQDYRIFHDHVFGDYRHGSPDEKMCTELDGAEREKAQELTLRAIKKHPKDERPIIAAAYFKIEMATPMLETILEGPNNSHHPLIRIYSAWAFFKINGSKKYLKILTDEATNPAALRLLADFGRDPVVVDVLLNALLDKRFNVSPTAHLALLKIFQDDFLMCELLKDRNYAISSNGWSNIAQEARLRLGS